MTEITDLTDVIMASKHCQSPHFRSYRRVNLGYKLEELSDLPRLLECLIHNKDLVQEDLRRREKISEICHRIAFHRVVFPHSAVFQFESFTHDVPPPPRVPSMSLEYIVCGAALGIFSFRHPSFSTTATLLSLHRWHARRLTHSTHL